MVFAFFQAVLLAFGLILPLGIQNVFIIQQSVSQPRYTRVLPVILTACICDTILIGLAVWGVSMVILGLPLLKNALIIGGIAFLIYMGFVNWLSKPAQSASNETPLSAKKQILFALSVSLLNPHAILDSVGVIGTSSLAYTGLNKIIFTTTCITVSWIWFFGLAFVGSQARKITDSRQWIIYLNKISSIVMWGTAIYLAYSLL
jgi:L-lysine exporter family protein LysE/ArgO